VQVPQCNDGQASNQSFCLVSCNLGCGGGGCSITDIAQNQPLRFEFNQPVNPATVGFGSIAIRTAIGEEPVGQFLVQGRVVEFAPQIQSIGNSTFFGFKPQATYTLVLRAGGDGGVGLRSVSGDVLGREVVCTLRVTRGIIDLDQQPPRAELITPSGLQSISRDASFVLEFSEIIDAAAFQGGPGTELPIDFRARRTRADGGTRVCDSSSSPIGLAGSVRVTQDAVRRRTTVSYIPSVRLPSEACIEIEVTNRVRDVAGTPARGQLFQLTTERGIIEGHRREELFVNEEFFDRDRSAGTWGNGAAEPALIGSDGRHGTFDLSLADRVGNTAVWIWNLERDLRDGVRGFLIPAGRTFSGAEDFVTDGVFRFTDFTVPSGATLRVVGSKAPRIWVAGKCDIQGRIDMAGETPDPALTDMTSTLPRLGQSGGQAGAGGGSGGKGGDRNARSGSAHDPEHDGVTGGDLWVASTHAYAGDAVGTGGKGSRQFPLSGLNQDRPFNLRLTDTIRLCTGISSGAGGGGARAAGTRGRTAVHPDPGDAGPPGDGGRIFDLSRDPLGRSSLEHNLIGGGGGGGGGTHSFFEQSINFTPSWVIGGGGGGGGGGIAFRVGGVLNMGQQAVIDVSGGNGKTTTNSNRCIAPGGGGSAGTVLFQVGQDPTLRGTLRAKAGLGGRLFFQNIFPTYSIEIFGGDGARGQLRLEVPSDPRLDKIGTTDPVDAKVVALLADRDDFVAIRSLYYFTGEVLPPRFTHYELEATIGGETRVFSDDPTKGSGQRAIPWDPTVPVGLLVQGARVIDGAPTLPSAWREFVGSHGGPSIDGDGALAFRFLLAFNLRLGVPVRVKRVTIYYES
jgi:hypothetical protein